MATSGGQPGNQNAAKGKRWRDAIEEAIAAFPQEPDYVNCLPFIAGLRRAAHAYVNRMMAEQDIAFFREFGDRIDGKSAQSLTLAGDEDNPLAFTEVTRKIIK